MKKFLDVIVKKNTKNLGIIGTIKRVKMGYASNYLIPNQIVEVATPRKIKHIKMFEDMQNKRFNMLLTNALNLKSQLEKIKKISLKKRIGENLHIFGSITEKEILKYIEQHSGEKIQKKQLIIPEIKQIGIYRIVIKIMDSIQLDIKLQILPINI